MQIIYYVLCDSGPEPRNVNQLAKMREAGTLSDETPIKQGIDGPWLTFTQLFDEHVEVIAESATPPPLPVSLHNATSEKLTQQHERRGLFSYWPWFGTILIGGAMLFVGVGRWEERRLHDLLGGLAMGATFLCLGLLVKLSGWIERQGGFRRAWSIAIARVGSLGVVANVPRRTVGILVCIALIVGWVLCSLVSERYHFQAIGNGKMLKSDRWTGEAWIADGYQARWVKVTE